MEWARVPPAPVDKDSKVSAGEDDVGFETKSGYWAHVFAEPHTASMQGAPERTFRGCVARSIRPHRPADPV